MAPFFLELSYIIVIVGAVAPGDEEPLCEQLRAQGTALIPAYSSNMRVLMDSWNYHNLLPDRTGAVWDQVDNDVNNPFGITTNTSIEDADTARNISNYQQVQRVSPSDTSGARVNETVTVSFSTSDSSFYFAIQDETSCIVVTRLIVFYYICPMQTADLITYPETFAPPGNQAGIPLVSVTASCVVNAEPENGLAPLPSCLSEGVWSLVPTAGCRCIAGSFQSNETCEACPVGTYLSPNNNSCSTCPANSVSEEEGLTQCTCVEGYQRALQGEEDLPCTPTVTAMAMNSTSGVSLAVIITIPSLFGLILLVALTTATIVLVCKRWNNQGTQAEAYYSTVGPPPLPPAKLEKNQSDEENLESLRIANTKDDIDNDSDSFYDEIAKNTSTDISIHHQTTVVVTTDENIAYYRTNTATASEIQTGENVAYSCELHDTIENIAYGTNIAIAPEIQVKENVAYNRSFDDTCGPQYSSFSNEAVTDMVPSSSRATDVSISAPEIET